MGGLLHPPHDLRQAVGRQVLKAADHQFADALAGIGVDFGKGLSLCQHAPGLDHDGTPERGQRYAQAPLADENRLPQYLLQLGDGGRDGWL